MLVSAGHDAPVHIPDGPCHPIRFVRKQERNGLGDILGGTDPTNRMKTVKGSEHSIEVLGGHEGFKNGQVS